VVGELPDENAIPAADFKTVMGGDLLNGRHPSYRPFSFKNEAAHVFMSNHLINTRDHSDAFFSRWLLVEFPNSRLRSGLPIDPGLADRIIVEELPGIAQWALDGAVRLLDQGGFSRSVVHERLMQQWRRSSNSVEEFVHDDCEVGEPQFLTRRSRLYVAYGEWCKETGRKPFAKGRFKDLLLHNARLGITLSEVNGYETFRGIKLTDFVSIE
jgi:putative DNA primase/helicase